jgi:hypothetical protein
MTRQKFQTDWLCHSLFAAWAMAVHACHLAHCFAVRCTSPRPCLACSIGGGLLLFRNFLCHPRALLEGLVLQLVQLLAWWAWCKPSWECIFPNVVADRVSEKICSESFGFGNELV